MFLPPLGHRLVHHRLESLSVNREDDVADPFLVLVVPPTFVWQVLHDVWLLSSVLDEVVDRQAIELRNDRHLD